MKLDEYQDMARTNLDRRVLLVAPPGSGKTTVLLAKIEFLTNEQGVDPSRILVLTFSRSASENMKERFLKLRPSGQPFFGTIHSLAYREIARRKGTIQLISQAQAMYALHPVRRAFSLSPEEVTKAISAISRERATGAIDESVPERFRTQVRTVYDQYKRDHQLMDFDDLEEEFAQMLDDDVYRHAMQEHIDWIMVDEFQDLNRIQLRILKLLGERCRLFCVGDEDQCIYAFRGSDTRAMVGFADEFRGGRILYLRYNYRCSATIVRHANRVIACNRERYPKEIINFRTDETPLKIHSFPDERQSWAYAARQLAALPRDTTCALIFRTNAELEEAAHHLLKRGIRFSFLDRPHDRYGRAILKNLIPYLQYAVHPDRRAFLQLIRTAQIRLPEEVLQQLSQSDHLKEQDLLSQDRFPLKTELREKLVQLFRDLKKLKRQKPEAAIRYILYVMGYHHWLHEITGHTGAPLAELVEEVEGFAREASAFPSIRDFLRYLTAWREILEQPGLQENILLSTMHGVKGMEFDEVLILNAYDGGIPHEKSLDDLEAERRLFYVAVTRAKNKLSVLHLQTWQGSEAEPSRFIRELGLPVEEAAVHVEDSAPAGWIQRVRQRISLPRSILTRSLQRGNDG